MLFTRRTQLQCGDRLEEVQLSGRSVGVCSGVQARDGSGLALSRGRRWKERVEFGK